MNFYVQEYSKIRLNFKTTVMKKKVNRVIWNDSDVFVVWVD